MDVPTEIITISLTSDTANRLRAEAARRNGSIDNLADSLIRAALATQSPERKDVG